MKPKKQTAKWVIIAIVVLIFAVFGLVDFKKVFKSEPKTVPEQSELETEKPEIVLSDQKSDQEKDQEDPNIDNAALPDAGPTDVIEPQDLQPDKSKSLTQDDSASPKSAIDSPAEKQKPAIVETDITAKDDALAKSAGSTPPPKPASAPPKSAATAPSKDDTPDKPKTPDADVKTDKPEAPPVTLPALKTDILIMQEGPGPYPYSIQLASFNEGNQAAFKKAFQKFEKKGLVPFWMKVDLGSKGVWYRVLSGCFRKKSEANAVIRAKNLKEAIVTLTKYAVRIGEYKDEFMLKQMLESLKKRGYFPYIIKKNTAEYVLYIGAFYSRKAAQKTIDELTVQGVSSEAVLR